ncbi:excinuclease ABC subunit B [Candidatus Campbellbacteria bacterium]|nr:MAG: excinuclease ABC subunit B [Candidatus Campbellbacteria bacterium]
MKEKFKLKTDFEISEHQKKAVDSLVLGLKKGHKVQTLHGATGVGKTFTMANIIQKVQKPTLVIAHNKTLAAQLASEFSEFFPENKVCYFVSYYDYYQPEAYIKVTDTFIEKEILINKEIDMLRHASTQALLSRDDVIIVASVSCIYGLGSPKEYKEVFKEFKVGDKFKRQEFLKSLVNMFYERTNSDLDSGKFRVVPNAIEICPADADLIFRLEIFGQRIEKILVLDKISKKIKDNIQAFVLTPAKHFITPEKQREKAILSIQEELKERLKVLQKEGKIVEAQRLERRTNYDIAMIREVGYCNGIENYSRHFSGKKEGEAPDTLLEYFWYNRQKEGFLTFIDESHITIPQIRGMFRADRARKENLVDAGFRLPSAKDNRPLVFDEFEQRIKQKICVTATPSIYEKENSENTVEQIIRPTGLLDPEIVVKPIEENESYKGQVFDFIEESEKVIQKGQRAMATVLTKKMAEDLSEFLKERKIKSVYLHSEVDTLDRIQIISDFRKGKYDILVGVNLLREGLDMPEVSLIGILDADKEGFLRSETSLVQTIGRAARNENGKVILYAEKITNSMQESINQTERRRKIQMEYNKKHGITPKTIVKNVKDIVKQTEIQHQKTINQMLKLDDQIFKKNPKKFLEGKRKEMERAAKELDFETASIIRDEIRYYEKKI